VTDWRRHRVVDLGAGVIALINLTALALTMRCGRLPPSFPPGARSSLFQPVRSMMPGCNRVGGFYDRSVLNLPVQPS